MSGLVIRRLATAILIPTSLLASLSACSDDVSSAPVPTPTDTLAPVELNLAVYGDQPTVAVYQQIADAYTDAHPETTFHITSVPDAATAATSAITSIASNLIPPDVFVLGIDQLPETVEAGVLQPVDELLEDEGLQFGDGFLRTALEAFSAENKLMCMPADVSPYVAYYNTDLIHADDLTQENGDALAQPIARAWDWKTFTSALDQAVVHGATGTYFPADLNALLPFLSSAGSNVVDDAVKPTRLELSSDASKEALKQIAALTRTPGMTLTPESVASTSAVTSFEQGKLGVLFATRAIVPALRATSGLHFDVAPLPAIDNVATTATITGYCIAKSSQNAQRAASFIAFATDGGGAKIAAASGFMVPSSIDAARSPEFLQLGQSPANALAFSEAGRRIVSAPYSTAWDDAVRLADSTLERVLYDPTVDVTSDETPLFDGLLKQTDLDSEPLFTPPEPTDQPEPSETD